MTALAPGVECLTLDRESFSKLIGSLSELHEKRYDDDKDQKDLRRGLAALGNNFVEKGKEIESRI